MEKSRRKLIMVLLVAIFAILTAVAIVTLAFAATQQQINTTLTIGYVAEDLDGSVYATYKIGNRETKYLIPTGADSDHINNNSLLFKATDKGNAGTLEFPESDRDISLTANEDLIIQYTYSNTGSKHYIASMSFDNALTYKNMTVKYSKDGETYSDERYAVVVPAESSDCSYWIKISIDDKSKNASLSGNFNWNLKGCDKSSKEYVSLTSMEFQGSAGVYSASLSNAGGTDGKIVFPSEINGDPVTTISQSTMTQEEKKLVTQVVIPNTVTKIGGGAFGSFTNLEEIDIPDSVTSIGGSAFFYSGIKSLTIGKNVKTIGGVAFGGTSRLETIEVDPENQTYYSENNCLIKRGENSERILIVGCKTSVIPDNITTIESQAFDLCVYLKEITIPASVKTIGKTNPFAGCTSTKITVDPENTNFYMDQDNNVLMQKETKKIISAFKSSTIPNDTKIIGDYSFYAINSSVTSVDVPVGVVEIGDNAFFLYYNLTNISLPNTLEKIGASAFQGTKLETITIPASVTSIGANPFSGTEITSINIDSDNANFRSENGFLIDSKNKIISAVKQENLVIPEGVTTINSYAFRYKFNYESITIANSVNTICPNAFYDVSYNITIENVIFNNTSGWFVANNSTDTSGTNLSSSDLSNPKTAATCLTSTYVTLYWRHS